MSDDDRLKGLKVTLTRRQVQHMSDCITDRVVGNLWASLLSDYPDAKEFNLLADRKWS